MIGRVIVYIILFILLGSLAFLVYNIIADYSGIQKVFTINNTIDRNQPSYSGSLQFYPNMRFDSRTISYSIDSNCDNIKKQRVLSALDYLETETNLLTFYEATNGNISFTCEEVKREPTGVYFTVGEGGPTSIVNASNFYVIQTGKVLLFYKTIECDKDNYNIELHELLHVFGFDHSSNKDSIMYNVTDCSQIVTSDIINEIKRLYLIPEEPDFAFDSASATQQGRYLNFSAEIKNIGLNNGDAKLELYADNSKFYEYNLGNIDYGEAKIVWGTNKLPSRQTSSIKFVITNGNELNQDNNVVYFST